MRDLRETCLGQLQAYIPAAMAWTADLGNVTLGELSASWRKACEDAAPQAQAASVQDGEDLVALASKQAEDILSPEHGQRLARALEEHFCALTASHLGPDFHPEFIQGDLVFALGAIRRDVPAILALAWGCVSGMNAGYPRGLLCGRGRPDSVLPGRLPVLPNKHRQTPLCLREAMQDGPPGLLLSRLSLKSPDSGPLTPAEERAARHLLATVYLHPQVLAQTTFSAQATVMNRLIWEQLFTPAMAVPPLIHLDMTRISLELIQADLKQRHSLLACMLEPGFPELLLEELNGVRGCWEADPTGESGLDPLKGSFLFWGIDRHQHLTPLMPDEHCRRLVSARSEFAALPLEKEALSEALAARTILPGLFLSFAVLALARGLHCCGGVYQIAYLEEMRLGLGRALLRQGENSLAETIARSRSGVMSTGYLPLRLRSGECSYAASTLDLLAAGGIDAALLDRLLALPAAAAFEAALAYHYEDILPPEERRPGWLAALASEAGIFLEPGGNID